MKITVLSDIHGNFPALEAVLRHARGLYATGMILNLGDATGYGPNPEQTVRRLQDPQFINIIGNYDKKVLSKEHRKAQWSSVKALEKREMFAWTSQALSKPSRKYLKSLPEKRQVEIDGVQILMTHGSPASLTEHLKPDTPDERLAELAASVKTKIVLCGHSHQAFVRDVNGVQFINPGTVGRPDDGDPRASYAILDIQKGASTAQLFRVPYNINASVQSMRQTGLKGIFTQIIRQGLNFDDVIKIIGKDPSLPALESNGIMTLLTDFGLKDHFVGVMKGVVAEIAPQADVIDISHQIRPQSVPEAARMLSEAAPYFPPGTVHVAVVDPGVGTDRRAIAARIGSHFYVAPDNGLLTLLINKAEEERQPVEIVVLDQPKYWLPEPGVSFHGRDIFAPVGAHLANGLPLEKLGTLIADPVMLAMPQPVRTSTGWQAEVVMVDNFGNLSTNLSAEDLPKDGENLKIIIQEKTIHGLTRTFGDVQPSTLIATIDSTGVLAIAEVNGSAKERLNSDIGTQVEIIVKT